jgi:hypothetical protein
MESTHEERMKVRRDECRVRGHSWDAVNVFSREDPVAFICGNCGRRVEVCRHLKPQDFREIAKAVYEQSTSVSGKDDG